jgi:hypothetical protein
MGFNGHCIVNMSYFHFEFVFCPIKHLEVFHTVPDVLVLFLILVHSSQIIVIMLQLFVFVKSKEKSIKKLKYSVSVHKKN